MIGRGYALIVWMTLSYALFLAEESVRSWLDMAAAHGGGQIAGPIARLLLGGP